MKRMFLLSPLLLLISATPATRPTTKEVDRLIVQVRRVEFTVKQGDSLLVFSDPTNVQVPADAKELSSIQTTTNDTGTFEAIAVINGTTCRLAGKVKSAAPPSKYTRLEIEYLERTQTNDTFSFTTNLMLEVDKPIRTGGTLSDDKAYATIITLKRP
jgi:hypothetical protein